MLDIILGHFLDCVLCQLLRLTSHRVVAHDHPYRKINRSGPVLADRMHDIAERDDTDQAIVVDHHGDRRSLALELSGNDDQRVLAMHPEDLAMVQLHDAVDEDRRATQIVDAHDESPLYPARVDESPLYPAR